MSILGIAAILESLREPIGFFTCGIWGFLYIILVTYLRDLYRKRRAIRNHEPFVEKPTLSPIYKHAYFQKALPNSLDNKKPSDFDEISMVTIY